jgi:hypothetical protein
MKEQLPDNEEREREEGRPDPEELLRRYGLRDRDHALGSAQRQSHAGAAQRGLQSALEGDLADLGSKATCAAHQSAAGREPAAADQCLLDPRPLGSTGVSVISPRCPGCPLTLG